MFVSLARANDSDLGRRVNFKRLRTSYGEKRRKKKERLKRSLHSSRKRETEEIHLVYFQFKTVTWTFSKYRRMTSTYRSRGKSNIKSHHWWWWWRNFRTCTSSTITPRCSKLWLSNEWSTDESPTTNGECVNCKKKSYSFWRRCFFCRNVVVTQPGRNVWDFEHPWSTTLCSCCNDMKQCNYFLFRSQFISMNIFQVVLLSSVRVCTNVNYTNVPEKACGHVVVPEHNMP